MRILVEEYNRHFVSRVGPDEIVSFRCGLRGLAVRRSTASIGRSITLSRRFVVQDDGRVPWVSIHGGKLTSCLATARSTVDVVRRRLRPTGYAIAPSRALPPHQLDAFPGLQESVPSARSCAGESCWTLEDYLRRRTNISQWVSRGGLGRMDENAAHLESLARWFPATGVHDPRTAVRDYRRLVQAQFDSVLDEVFV
jgi:glycerol-3-phosphate dehydrogenase